LECVQFGGKFKKGHHHGHHQTGHPMQHLQDLNLRSGLAHKLTPPFTDLSCPGPNGLKVADICVVKGYPRSDIHHLTFNEDTF